MHWGGDGGAARHCIDSLRSSAYVIFRSPCPVLREQASRKGIFGYGITAHTPVHRNAVDLRRRDLRIAATPHVEPAARARIGAADAPFVPHARVSSGGQHRLRSPRRIVEKGT